MDFKYETFLGMQLSSALGLVANWYAGIVLPHQSSDSLSPPLSALLLPLTNGQEEQNGTDEPR